VGSLGVQEEMEFRIIGAMKAKELKVFREKVFGDPPSSRMWGNVSDLGALDSLCSPACQEKQR
jgi:hypothetical protein